MVLTLIRRILMRILTETLDLQPMETPPESKADWPKSSTDSEPRLRVLSLNIWGLPIAPLSVERTAAFGASLMNCDYELVVLQEVWHQREKKQLVTAGVQAGFEYYHYFQRAAGFPLPFGPNSFGTGILVLSKYPIVEAQYHSYTVSGKPYAFHEGDHLGNKGAGLLRIQTPVGEIDVYATHLIANYNYLGAPGDGDLYLPQRAGQSYELARLINSTAKNGLVLVCGDFNSPADCICLRIQRNVIQIGEVKDAFLSRNKQDEGLTFGTVDNKFSHGDHPMRMDYIHYVTDTTKKKNKQDNAWHLINCNVHKQFFTDVNGDSHPISDHFGVLAEFRFTNQSNLSAYTFSKFGTDENYIAEDKEIEGRNKRKSSDSCDLHSSYNAFAIDMESLQCSNSTVGCLEETKRLLTVGEQRAMGKRSSHLMRASIHFIGLLFAILFHYQMSWTNFLLIMSPIFLCGCICEYLLAFYYAQVECSGFTELISELQLHLNACQAKEAFA